MVQCNGGKTIEKPSKAMMPGEKIMTIPDHHVQEDFNLTVLFLKFEFLFDILGNLRPSATDSLVCTCGAQNAVFLNSHKSLLDVYICLLFTCSLQTRSIANILNISFIHICLRPKIHLSSLLFNVTRSLPNFEAAL